MLLKLNSTYCMYWYSMLFYRYLLLCSIVVALSSSNAGKQTILAVKNIFLSKVMQKMAHDL